MGESALSRTLSTERASTAVVAWQGVEDDAALQARQAAVGALFETLLDAAPDRAGLSGCTNFYACHTLVGEITHESGYSIVLEK